MAKAADPDPVERICRILCRHEGHPENIKMDGKPMWESYRGAVEKLLWALKDGDKLPSGLVVKRDGA